MPINPVPSSNMLTGSGMVAGCGSPKIKVVHEIRGFPS